jgi:hypothetical protein
MRTLQVSLVERVFVVGACLLSLFVVTSVRRGRTISVRVRRATLFGLRFLLAGRHEIRPRPKARSFKKE